MWSYSKNSVHIGEADFLGVKILNFSIIYLLIIFIIIIIFFLGGGRFQKTSVFFGYVNVCGYFWGSLLNLASFIG